MELNNEPVFKKDELTDLEVSYESDSEPGSEDEGEEKKVVLSKEFQETVIKFVKIDDIVRKKEKELKELKNQRKPYEKYILDYLETVNENVIDISTGKLRKNKFETKVPLTLDIMRNAIKEKVKDVKVVEDIIKLMDTLRPKNVRINLKRTSNRDNNK